MPTTRHHRSNLTILWIASLATAMSSNAHAATTPYAQTGKLEIQRVISSAPTVPQFSQATFRVELTTTYDNPFDPADISLGAQVSLPSGARILVPGFLNQDFERDGAGGGEKLTPAGKPYWQVRFAPWEIDRHEVVIVARDRSGRVQSAPLALECARSDQPGFVRLGVPDKRYFVFDNGKPYFPIGPNICWAYRRGTYDYDEWFPRYAQAGGNYARLWLSPHWTTFALEQPGKPAEGRGMGQFDLSKAWRIDYVLQLAARHGLQVMLCIDSYNILRARDAYPQWDSTPHNAKNGGPLAQPTDFWTNLEMDRLYRNKLRYLVARYGAYANVLSWEFWNEVDITTGYRSAPAVDWHRRTARALRTMDPYRHLITTSTANTAGDRELDVLPELDYVQTHHYNNPDLAVIVARSHAQKTRYGKPHIMGEIGADSGGPRTQDDQRGYQVHDPMWASLAVGDAGAAQSWWWDNFIHPRNLYPLYAPVAKFTAGVDWPAEGFAGIEPRLEWRDHPQPLPRKDVLIESGPVSWEKSEFNQPRTVRVTKAGVQGSLPLAGIQHGLGGHKDKHNPVTFEFELPWASRLEVEVGKVSGWGGAVLKILLDDHAELAKTFADDDGTRNTRDLSQYAGVYGIDVPAGKHRVVVENTGPDWFMAGYRIKDAVEATGPSVVAWGIAGKTTAIVWARASERTWQRLCVHKEKFAPIPPSRLVLPGLAPGEWQAENWDTWTGNILKRETIRVVDDGLGCVMLEGFEHDVALKLRKR